MGLASCLGYYNLTTGRLTKIAATPGVAGTRINDGRCDRMGNFVFSTMYAGEPVQPVGRFHRLNAATLETETLDLPEVAPRTGNLPARVDKNYIVVSPSEAVATP